jgi:hypothetical protein
VKREYQFQRVYVKDIKKGRTDIGNEGRKQFTGKLHTYTDCPTIFLPHSLLFCRLFRLQETEIARKYGGSAVQIMSSYAQTRSTTPKNENFSVSVAPLIGDIPYIPKSNYFYLLFLIRRTENM